MMEAALVHILVMVMGTGQSRGVGTRSCAMTFAKLVVAVHMVQGGPLIIHI